MRMHISANGRPAPCQANEGACPLGESTIHGDFNSVEDATGWAEEFHAKKAGGTFGGGLSKAPKVNEEAARNKAALYDGMVNGWTDETAGNNEIDFGMFYQAQDVPFTHTDELSPDFTRKAMDFMKKDYERASREYVDEMTDGEAESPGFVEEYNDPSWAMGEAVGNLLKDDKTTDPSTGEEKISALGINGLHSVTPNGDLAERANLQSIPLKPMAKDYLLTKRYGDSNYAEPSNILKIIAEENSSVKLTQSAFPVDGKRESDRGRFSVDGVEFSYDSKRDKVWISVVGKEGYEFSFEDNGTGQGLKNNLEKVVKNAKGIRNYADSGRSTSEFTRRLSGSGGNL